MAIAKFKAMKEFQDGNFRYGIGMVMIADPKDITYLIETGRVVLDKYLDPADAKDVEEIEHFTDNPEGKIEKNFLNVKEYTVLGKDGVVGFEGKLYEKGETIHLESEGVTAVVFLESGLIEEVKVKEVTVKKL